MTSHPKLIAGVSVASVAILAALTVTSQTDVTRLYATAVKSLDEGYRGCLQQLLAQHPTSKSKDWEVTEVTLDSNNYDDFIFKSTDATQCGTGGCVFEICFVESDTSNFTQFGYAGNSLTPLATTNNNKRDLELKGQSVTTFTYDGSQYQLEQPLY